MIAMKKTTLRKRGEPINKWVAIDANGLVVGRLAAKIAMILMGKERPDYTPYIDMGDYVIVTNCEKVAFTGSKWTTKIYRHHSGYIGGLKEYNAKRVCSMHPDRILYQAVKRMLPKGKLGESMIKKLKLFVGSEHTHHAQNPEVIKPVLK